MLNTFERKFKLEINSQNKTEVEKEKLQQADYDYIVTPYPEQFARIVRLPYPLVYLLLSFTLFGIYLLSCYQSGENFEHAEFIALFSFLTGSIAVAIIWFSKALEKFTPSILLFIDWPKEQTLAWYETKIRSIFRLKWMAICGVALSTVCLISIYCTPLWKNFKGAPKIVFVAIYFLACFLGGGLLYSMGTIAKMVYDLGKIDSIKVSIYQHPVTSVKAVGALLNRISLSVIAIYLLGISSIYFERELLHANHINFLSILFGAVVIFFFVFPQNKIHKIMSKVKHLKLRKFSIYLEESLESVTKDPSRRNVQKVRELFEIQRSLNGMGEWPFDTRLLIIILTGVAIPLIIGLLQVLCNFIKSAGN